MFGFFHYKRGYRINKKGESKPLYHFIGNYDIGNKYTMVNHDVEYFTRLLESHIMENIKTYDVIEGMIVFESHEELLGLVGKKQIKKKTSSFRIYQHDGILDIKYYNGGKELFEKLLFYMPKLAEYIRYNDKLKRMTYLELQDEFYLNLGHYHPIKDPLKVDKIREDFILWNINQRYVDRFG